MLQGWGTKLDELDSRLNVNGSGISLGHPIGATGARILTTMLHELKRRGGRYALETMCVGGGQGVAAVFEARVSARPAFDIREPAALGDRLAAQDVQEPECR